MTMRSSDTMTTDAKKKYRVVASPLFKLSLRRFRAFLERSNSSQFATNTVLDIKRRIEQELSPNPELAPVSERLFALGLNEYRQWTLDEHNLVFYKVDSTQCRVELLLIMDGRQSVRKLLFELNLLI